MLLLLLFVKRIDGKWRGSWQRSNFVRHIHWNVMTRKNVVELCSIVCRWCSPVAIRSLRISRHFIAKMNAQPHLQFDASFICHFAAIEMTERETRMTSLSFGGVAEILHHVEASRVIENECRLFHKPIDTSIMQKKAN